MSAGKPHGVYQYGLTLWPCRWRRLRGLVVPGLKQFLCYGQVGQQALRRIDSGVPCMSAEPVGSTQSNVILIETGLTLPLGGEPLSTTLSSTGRWLNAISGAGEPSVPEFCRLVAHQPHDTLRWVPEKIKVHKITCQKWEDARIILKHGNVHPLNGCVRDAIMERPDMLPLELLRQKLDAEDLRRPPEELRIFFPGTRYVNAGAYEEIGGIQWSTKEGRWVGITRRLQGSWEGDLILSHEDAARVRNSALAILFPWLLTLALLSALVFSNIFK